MQFALRLAGEDFLESAALQPNEAAAEQRNFGQRCSDKCLRSLAKDIRERAHGWVAARAERQGTADDVGLFRRLVPRCVRRPDVQLVIPTVISLWGLSRGEAGLVGTVPLLISSLGGWFAGTLADKFGRVKMLQITILWCSFFTSCAHSRSISRRCSPCALTVWGSAASRPPVRC